MKLRFLTSVATALVALSISAPLAQANPILELISGSSVTTVVGSAGQAMFMGNFAGWSINIDSGLAAPADGAVGDSLDLSCIDIAGAHAASLTIIFSAGIYSTPGGPAAALASLDSLNTSTGATLTTYYGPAIGAENNVLTAPISAGLNTGIVPTGGPYYLTEKLVLGAGRIGSVDSVDADLNLTVPSVIHVPDGGTTVILLGGVMAALTLGYSRVRKIK